MLKCYLVLKYIHILFSIICKLYAYLNLNVRFLKVLNKFLSLLQVTDMMLQDKPYPDWGKSARAFWKKGNVRIDQITYIFSWISFEIGFQSWIAFQSQFPLRTRGCCSFQMKHLKNQYNLFGNTSFPKILSPVIALFSQVEYPENNYKQLCLTFVWYFKAYTIPLYSFLISFEMLDMQQGIQDSKTKTIYWSPPLALSLLSEDKQTA